LANGETPIILGFGGSPIRRFASFPGAFMLPVMVTGGCGFIGSIFIRYLLETDPDICLINLDSLTYAGNLTNLEDVAKGKRYRFIRGDIADRQAVRQVVESGVRAIFNFAAESHVDRSIHDSSPFVRTNILGTQVLLDAAREFKVPRYIQISTDEVYGSLGATGYFTEETPLAPNSPYAASKASADLLVRSYIHTFGLPATITRCSNNYGPYQFPEKLIPLFIMNLLRNEPIPVYGDGLNVRDWIHVRDHCAAIDRVWRAGRVGEIYNIGGRCERTNLDLTNALLEVMGKPRSLIRFVKDRPGHDRRYAIDSTKIQQELGWHPAIPFDEGLRDTVRWYEEHSEWVASIRTGQYLQYYEKQYGRELLGKKASAGQAANGDRKKKRTTHKNQSDNRKIVEKVSLRKRKKRKRKVG
jgi:dTDP-glucose 4,6-dehydratase